MKVGLRLKGILVRRLGWEMKTFSTCSENRVKFHCVIFTTLSTGAAGKPITRYPQSMVYDFRTPNDTKTTFGIKFWYGLTAAPGPNYP